MSRAASAMVKNSGSSLMSSSASSWQRDREAAHDAVALDQARDEPGSFRLFDKFPQESSASRILPRRTDGLLHRCKLAVEDAGAGEFCGILQQPRAQPGKRLELFADELLEGAIAPLGPNELGVLDVAFEPEIVGAASSHGDPRPGAVDVGDGSYRRTRGHQVGRLDLDIGRREGDLFSAL